MGLPRGLLLSGIIFSHTRSLQPYVLYMFWAALPFVAILLPSHCLSKKRSSRFNCVAFSTASLLLFTALILMLIGLFVLAVPISVFYWGYLCLWLCLPFWIGAFRGEKAFALAVLGLALFWIVAPNIVVPIPEITKGYAKRTAVVREEDDRIEDKSPIYIPDFTEIRQDRHGEFYYFNKSSSVIGLDLADATAKENKLARRIYPTFKSAKNAAASFDCEFLPSVDLLDGLTKYMDDRLVAAVEDHVHDGSNIFPGGKQGFLDALLAEVLNGPEAPGRDRAIAYLAAAVELGGGRSDVPERLDSMVELYKREFLRDPRNSRPIGFYAESGVLQKVFRRDRFLQKPFRNDLSPTARMAEALLRRPDLLEAYSRFRELAERVCNPEANLNLEDLFPYRHFFADNVALHRALTGSDAWQRACRRGNINLKTLGVAFWPFSTSKETRLFAALYTTPYLPRTEMMSDLVRAVKEERLSLEPEPESGWYDYQLYSLETLLLTEKSQEVDKLLLFSRYKKRLRESFEAMLTKRRETHVKQFFQPMGLCAHARFEPMVPEVTLEPCATNYLRTARAYRYLRGVLCDLLGRDEVERIALQDTDMNLLEGLDSSIALFYGFYLVVCNDIGMTPKLVQDEIQSLPDMKRTKVYSQSDSEYCLIDKGRDVSGGERSARYEVWLNALGWLRSRDSNEFMDEDVRVIVPVFTNLWGARVRNWTVIGIRLVKIRAYYAIPPRVGRKRPQTHENEVSAIPEELTLEGPAPSGYAWGPREYVIPVQVFAEVTLGPKPLTREEFRRICDRCRTKEEIVTALSFGLLAPKRFGAIAVFALVVIVLASLSSGVVLSKRRRFR